MLNAIKNTKTSTEVSGGIAPTSPIHHHSGMLLIAALAISLTVWVDERSG
jgi:hypothetical protein